MAKVSAEITIRMTMDEARAARFALGRLCGKHYEEAGLTDIRDDGAALYACLDRALPRETDPK